MSFVFNEVEISRNIVSTRYSVKVATTADLSYTYNGTTQTLTAGSAGLTTLDGYQLVDEDKVLVKNQTNQDENGIYAASATEVGSATILTRVDDLQNGKDANSRLVWVQTGTLHGGEAYVCTSPVGSDIVGTHDIIWTRYDVTKTLEVSRGGTGSTSFTADRIIISNGTGDALIASSIDPTTLVTGTGTDNHIVRWNGTGQPIIQDSTNAQIDDSDNITGLSNIGLSGNIIDANGNELINFTTIVGAVNEIAITNAATGNNPIIGSTGGDTNIGINFQAKGTGYYNFLSTASQSSEIRWFEDTDNGTNYMGFAAPSAITTSYTLVWPDGVGTNGQVLTTDGNNPASLTWANAAASKYFMLTTVQVRATKQDYETFAYFPWDHSDLGGATARTVTFWAVTPSNRSLDVQVWNGTTQLGTINVATSSSGISTFTFTDPGADANLEFRVKKSASGGSSPSISGIYLNVMS